MNDGILEASVGSFTGTTRRWRQLCYLTTIEVRSPQFLLQAAADILTEAFGADGCLITYDPPLDPPFHVVHGTLSPALQELITDSEKDCQPRQIQPESRAFADQRLISVPLLVNGGRAGFVHLAADLDADALDDLRLAVMMLNNTLDRQAAADQAQRAVRKTLHGYQAVQRAITRVLAESPSLGDATPTILQSLCESLEWDAGIYWAVDRASGTLRPHAAWHRQDIDVREFLVFCDSTPHDRGVGLPGRVWASGEPVWVSDVVQDANFPGALIAAKQRLRKACGFPIRAGDEIRGVIALYSRMSGPPDRGVITLLGTYGSQIGQFIERRRVEVALWERDQEYRATFEQAAVGIAHVGLDGRWLSFNRRLCEIVGYDEAALTERTFQQMTHPDDLAADLELVRRLLDGEIATYSLEKRYLRAAGDVVWVNLTVSLMRDAAGQPKYFIAVVEDIDARKRAEAETARLTEELRQERDRLLRREVEVRTQIGRDLHDGPVQQVAVAAISTQYVQRVAQHAPEQLNEALRDLENQLKRATQDLRTVLYELRPLGISEEGLVIVLQQYIGKLRAPQDPAIHLHAPADLRRLSPDHEAAMFIIVQEAINNVRKHARARNIWISLSDDGRALCATVRDDGRGFPVEEVQRSYVQRGSFGLLNMTERAQLIGGECRFESAPGAGTSVHVRIPFDVVATPVATA
jgi:PAS domain S-box-containing protein